jgi:glutamyl-tRNA synthetase
MARSSGGQFLIRLEDTDRNRYDPASVPAIYEGLRWLGIDWDEGPDIGGPFGPYVQSERLEMYQSAAAKLVDEGKAYACFCTPERLDALRAEQAARKQPPGYDGLCRALSRDEAAARARDEAHVVRFKMKREGQTVLRDLVRGEVVFENALQDDFVALKSDRYPTYHLALIVDDTAMEITHAIRGEEWISSAPKHIQLYEAMGYEPTQFAHLPLIIGNDRKKLSKRSGDTALRDYAQRGYLPEAMLNFLALLGWSLDDKTTLISRDDLVSHFDITRVVANPAVFDLDRLNYLNGHYIREMPTADWEARIAEWAERDLPRAVPRPLDAATITAVAPLLRERVHTLSDIAPMIEFLFGAEAPEYARELLAERLGGDRMEAVRVVDQALLSLDALTAADWTRENVEAAIRGLEEPLGMKLRKFASVLYVAIMGRPQGIPLFESVELLGRERTLSRLRAARGVLE